MKLFDSVKKFAKKVTRQDKTDEELRLLNSACKTYVKNRTTLKNKAVLLYNNRKAYLKTIQHIQKELSGIQNIPEWGQMDLGDSLIRLESFSLAVKYENNPEELAKLDKSGRTKTYMGIGIAAGGTTAIWGSTAAMSIATVLGTASTGTAISALGGVAATNAALAWLGGGAVAAGGAGMAGGQLLLAMFGPIGVTIAGVSTTAGILVQRSKNKKKAEEIHSKLGEIKHDNKEMRGKLNHLNDLIKRGKSLYESELKPSYDWIKKVMPKNYEHWGDEDKHKLESLLSNVSNMAMLINERI